MRCLMANASPPMRFEDPGRIKLVVTPPELMTFMAGSQVLKASIERISGVSGREYSLVSEFPTKTGHESVPTWECISTRPGVRKRPFALIVLVVFA